MQLKAEELLQRARKCLDIESSAIRLTSDRLDIRFIRTLEMLQQCITGGNKLIFAGVGKNVPICMKLTGTFNSTGVPTTFLDPNQALHGDLGFCKAGDLAILISNSGETEDLIRIIPHLRRLGIRIIAMTARLDSTLTRFADHCLPYQYEREACPLELAPTASTTAALALGDALAMVYLEIRGFDRDDFARYHPAGSLGQALLMRIGEIMRTGERFACAPRTITVKEALLAITKARCGSIALTDPDSGELSGVFSDGDFRRSALNDTELLEKPVEPYMTRHPKVVHVDELAVEALKIFEAHRVDDLIAIDDQNIPKGIVDGQDMPKLRML